MKTTQQKAVTAFTTINRMSQKPMNSFTAYKLFRLKKDLKEAVDFMAEQEMKIIEELGGSVAENGQIVLDDEKKKVFAEQHKELEETLYEMDRGKTEINLHELKDISLAEMEALEDFVEWKGTEGVV